MTLSLIRQCTLALLFTSTSVYAVNGNMAISMPALGDRISIATSSRFAGAITSLKFRGREYIDTHDHGREMQSASSFDHLGECYNPTEAGTSDDGKGVASSSKLLSARTGTNWLQTETDMAYWLSPGTDYKRLANRSCGERNEISTAVNTAITGKHLLKKKVTIGYGGIANVINYEVAYKVPRSYRSAVFESVTVYTPKKFTKRLVFNPVDGKISETAIIGEQALPVILMTPDARNAIGIYSPALPQNGLGYGSFEFDNTNKLNCVFREVDIAPTSYRYRCFFAVGTLQEVTEAIAALRLKFNK